MNYHQFDNRTKAICKINARSMVKHLRYYACLYLTMDQSRFFLIWYVHLHLMIFYMRLDNTRVYTLLRNACGFGRLERRYYGSTEIKDLMWFENTIFWSMRVVFGPVIWLSCICGMRVGDVLVTCIWSSGLMHDDITWPRRIQRHLLLFWEHNYSWWYIVIWWRGMIIWSINSKGVGI